jgi:hypothetical protein
MGRIGGTNTAPGRLPSRDYLPSHQFRVVTRDKGQALSFLPRPTTPSFSFPHSLTPPPPLLLASLSLLVRARKHPLSLNSLQAIPVATLCSGTV